MKRAAIRRLPWSLLQIGVPAGECSPLGSGVLPGHPAPRDRARPGPRDDRTRWDTGHRAGGPNNPRCGCVRPYPEPATTTGQEALKGLAAIGVGNLGHAAGVVGMNIAQYLGQAEKVSRLYNLFRGFAIQAYEAVLALVGNQLAQTMAGKVVEWFDQVQKGRKFELLEWLYQTGPTGRDLGTFIKDSKATPDRFLKAFQEVAALEGRVRWNLNLASKFVAGLGYIGGVPVAACPRANCSWRRRTSC